MCQTKRLLFYPFLWVSILNYGDSPLSACFLVVLKAKFRAEKGFNGVNLPPCRERRNAGFCSIDGATCWRFPDLTDHRQYSKKGKRQWPIIFFRKEMRGALGWSMVVGAVSAHAARPFGDAEVWDFAPFSFDNKAFGLAKKCA